MSMYCSYENRWEAVHCLYVVIQCSSGAHHTMDIEKYWRMGHTYLYFNRFACIQIRHVIGTNQIQCVTQIG